MAVSTPRESVTRLPSYLEGALRRATTRSPVDQKTKRGKGAAGTASTPSSSAPPPPAPKQAARDIVRVCPATNGTLRVVDFRGQRVVEAQNLGREVLGYSEGRKLADKISADAEYVEGIHYFKVVGADLAEFKASRSDSTDSVESLAGREGGARSLLLVTPKGTRLAAMKAQTKAGVAAREWLTEVWREIDETGSYHRPDAPPPISEADIERFRLAVTERIKGLLSDQQSALLAEIMGGVKNELGEHQKGMLAEFERTMKSELAERQKATLAEFMGGVKNEIAEQQRAMIAEIMGGVKAGLSDLRRVVAENGGHRSDSIGTANANEVVHAPVRQAAMDATGTSKGKSYRSYRTRAENDVRSRVAWPRPHKFENFPSTRTGDLIEAMRWVSRNAADLKAQRSASSPPAQENLPFDKK